MSDPSAAAPPPHRSEADEIAAAAMQHFTLTHTETWQRWSRRGTYIGYGVAAAAFLLTAVVAGDAVPDGWFVLAILVAAVALWATIAIVYPRLPQPQLPCPRCAKRVPLAAPTVPPFLRIDALRSCPHCGVALPTLF